MSNADTNGSAVKPALGRSPAYPFIPLGKAIERVEQVYEARVGQNAYPPGTFYKVWTVGAKSSTARQTMAALNHFGLVDYVGRGDDRSVRLSELAIKIAQDKRPDSDEREAAVRQAALTPPIHRKLFEKFPPPMPDDVFVKHFLVSDSGYNEGAADALIKEYKDTLLFAKMDQPANMPTDDDDGDVPDGQNMSTPTEFGVGDFVNWESGEQIQWRQPRKIICIDEHDGQRFYQVEDGSGQKGWIPVEQAISHQSPSAPSTASNFAPPPANNREDKLVVGSRKAVFPVEDGDVTLIFPEAITADGLEELGEYLEIFLKKERKKKVVE